VNMFDAGKTRMIGLPYGEKTMTIERRNSSIRDETTRKTGYDSPRSQTRAQTTISQYPLNLVQTTSNEESE